MLLPLALLASCHDDDDVPNVDLYVSFDNVAVKNNVIYAVKDSAIRVTDVSVQGVGSKAMVTSVTYFWDNLRVGWSPVTPFEAVLSPAVQTVGNHLFGLNAEIAQVDKSLGFITTNFDVKVVETVEELPDSTALGKATIELLSNKK